MKATLILAIAIFCSVSIGVHAAETDGAQKAVLITGASSGFGRATAEYLAKQGYLVYAGARKPEDIDALNRIENIRAIQLDVTDQEDIDAAVELVRAEGSGLWGLVNNAGVLVIAPMTEVSDEDVWFQYNVNVFGVIRVTKAFAPLIIESEGRIVNVSSISGVISAGFAGVYASSKHALEAITDSLADELGRFNVHVAAVNPGGFSTEIGASYCLRMSAQDEDWGPFEESRQAELDYCNKESKSDNQQDASPLIPVATAIEHALFSESPRTRYLVVERILEAESTIAHGLLETLRLNAGYEDKFSREELFELMNDLWPYANGDMHWKDPDERWDFLDEWRDKNQR